MTDKHTKKFMRKMHQGKRKGVVRRALSGAVDVGRYAYQKGVKPVLGYLGVKGSAGAFVGLAVAGLPGAVIGAVLAKNTGPFMRARADEIARARLYLSLNPEVANHVGVRDAISRVHDVYNEAVDEADGRTRRFLTGAKYGALGVAAIGGALLSGYANTLENAGRYREVERLAEGLGKALGRPVRINEAFEVENIARLMAEETGRPVSALEAYQYGWQLRRAHA